MRYRATMSQLVNETGPFVNSDSLFQIYQDLYILDSYSYLSCDDSCQLYGVQRIWKMLFKRGNIIYGEINGSEVSNPRRRHGISALFPG